MPTFKYVMQSKDGQITRSTLVDPVDCKTEAQAKLHLEKMFPGTKVKVKLINERPLIENRAETIKSSKEIAEAGFAAMRAKLGGK